MSYGQEGGNRQTDKNTHRVTHIVKPITPIADAGYKNETCDTHQRKM